MKNRLFLAFALLACAGCATGADDSTPSPSHDASVDAAIDASHDASIDTTHADTIVDTNDANVDGFDATGEICGNGLDDNGNGLIDEGCACTAGTTQACYTGPAIRAGVGDCKKGTQSCAGGGWGDCTGSVLPAKETCDGVHDENCDGTVDEGCPMHCTGGPGLILTVPDACVDDYGSSSSGDSLEVYCFAGIVRFCLSGEACPWRGATSASDSKNCVTSGLPSDGHMATVHSGCATWNGHFDFYCNPDGSGHF